MDKHDAVEITEKQGITVVVFNADSISGIDNLQGVSKKIMSFIADNHPRKIVVDFVRVRFFSSQTLGLLLDIWRKLQEYDGHVVISGINPQLHRVFKITNLDKIFTFYPDQAEALKAMKTG